MAARRPFKASVLLPGQGEGGRPVHVRTVTAATQEGLDRALARWVADGYAVAAWEDLELPLEEEG